MRLPNGYGSAYKLSGKRRKPWIARVTIGWADNGKQILQTVGYFENKKEAMNALALHRIDPISPKVNITFKEIYEEWSKAKYEYISKSTVGSYKAGWKHLSQFQNVKFKELRSAHVQSIIDKCYKAGMSRSSLEKIKVVATMIYDYAMQNDIVNKNYAEFVKLPKVDKVEKKIFSEIEIKKMQDQSDVQWVDTILILIYTGMRISEMLNLMKFNIDLDKGIITGGIKTDAGKNRIIPIHPKIYKYIAKWYNQNNEYLITDDKGEKLSPKTYRENKYYPALEYIEVRKLNPHCCRHTFASRLRNAGADTKSIQELIGHSDYAFTANEYTHIDIDALKNAIKKI